MGLLSWVLLDILDRTQGPFPVLIEAIGSGGNPTPPAQKCDEFLFAQYPPILFDTCVSAKIGEHFPLVAARDLPPPTSVYTFLCDPKNISNLSFE